MNTKIFSIFLIIYIFNTSNMTSIALPFNEKKGIQIDMNEY